MSKLKSQPATATGSPPARKQPKKQAISAKKPANGQSVAPKAKRGRPSKFTPELADEIVLRISNGEPLREICRDEHMPAWRTFYDWQEADKAFSARIARARELGEEAIAQECLAIADTAKNDWMETHGQDDVGYKLNGEHIQRSKLRIETRLKLLAKWNPRKWGEKVDLNHGVQPENPLANLVQRIAGSGLPVIKENGK